MSFPRGMDWESFHDEYYENIYDEEWPFVFENLGRRAYKAMYRAARKIGMNPEQAKTFCTSKFARHSEDLIDEAFYKAMLPLVKSYNQHLIKDKDFSTWNDDGGGAIGKKKGRRLGIVWKFDEVNHHQYVEPLWNYRKNPTKMDIISLTRISPSIDLWMATMIFGRVGGKDTPRINRTRKKAQARLNTV